MSGAMWLVATLCLIPVVYELGGWGFARFLWKRATETDADKAQRYLCKSQRFLQRARDLGAEAQRTTDMVEDEFNRRLRLVAGDDTEGTPK